MAILKSAPFSEGFGPFTVSTGNGAQHYNANGAPEIPGRVEILPGPGGSLVYSATCYDTDPEYQATGVRAEVSMAPDDFNTPYWYVWEMYIPSGGIPEDGQDYCLGQIHDSPDEGDPEIYYPILGIHIRDGHFEVHRADDFVTPNTKAKIFAAFKVRHDTWLKCGIFASWRKDSQGFIEVYLDGQPAYKMRGISAYDDVVAPYLKLGVYDIHHYLNFGVMRAFYRNCKVTDGVDGPLSALGEIPRPVLGYVDVVR